MADPFSSSERPVENFLLQAVTNMAAGSINVFDRELRYLFAAGQGLSDVGLDPMMLVGRTLSEVFGDEAAEPVRQFYLRAFAGESVVFEISVKDRTYQVSAAPLPPLDAIVAVAQDVTDRRHQAVAMVERDRRKDEFIVTLAHELRQPLGTMRIALGIMRQRPGQAGGERAREILERQVDRLQRLTDDLVDAARVTQRRVELTRERFDLRTSIADVLLFVESEVKAAGLRLHTRIPAEPVWLYGDPNRLQQVFSNLLQNAAKFTGTGGEIHVEMIPEEAQVVVRVRDTGRGIRPDMLPHIFELFTQSEEGGGGLGIGLAVVKRLVEAHSGSVTAFSRGQGMGAEFTVRLPLDHS